MQRMNRLFEIIQILRSESRAIRAEDLAEKLEVSVRTIYRDIAALQGMHTPIEGEPGIGYVMRRGYDLPPLNFDEEEIEALRVGLSMLARSGDSSLQRASLRVCKKIDSLHSVDWIQVAPWGAPKDDPDKGCVRVVDLRRIVREERKLRITYRNQSGEDSTRVIRPIAVVYHLEAVILAAWCELRDGFRHFRTDRIYSCEELDEVFTGQADTLRLLWQEKNSWEVQRIP